MSGPWEKYADLPDAPEAEAEGPWLKYGPVPGPAPNATPRMAVPWESLEAIANIPSNVAAWMQSGDGRRFVEDLIAQGGMTAGGIALGSAVGGPVGGIAGGAIGSVLGKAGNRFVTGEPQPGAGETTLDAVAGGFGPAVGPALRTAGRLATGISRKGITEVERRLASVASRSRAMDEEAAAMAKTARAAETDDAYRALGELERAGVMTREQRLANIDRLIREKAEKAGQDRLFARMQEQPFRDILELLNLHQMSRLSKAELAKLVKDAIETVQGRTSGAAAAPGAAVGALAFGLESLTAVFLSAGVSHTLLKSALPRILAEPARAERFVKWALNLNPKTAKPGEIAASVAAIAGEGAVLPERPRREPEPAAVPERRSTKPFQDRVPPQRPQRHGRRPTPPRDAQGRWVGRGAIDHSGLEEMFEGAFTG